MSEPAVEGAPASVAENIDKIIRSERELLERRSRLDAAVDAVGGFFGTLAFVMVQILACAGWIALNAGGHAVDPFPFPLLATITSFEAVLIAAFVLMKQNRMSAVALRRDHLDLQVNLRTERQATQIIQMLDRLSAHIGFEHDHDDAGRELGQHRRLPDTQS